MSDPLEIGVVVATFFVLWLTVVVLHHRANALSIQIAQEMASQLIRTGEVIDEIAHIPSVLQDLNLGGVELRPPKSIVELGFEWLMNRNAPEGVNSTPPLAESWPEHDQEQPRTEAHAEESPPSLS